MTRRARTAAFTLIELLIAVGLGMLIMLLASNFLISSSRMSSDVQSRNELLEESQIVQNYMASQLREAVYVFPPGTVINMGTGNTTRRPGGGTWTVGDVNVPIVAFIRPPSLRAGVPDPNGGTVNACGTSSETRSCYAFLAYYPVLRSTWVSGTSGSSNPGADEANKNRWVLVEYRHNYDFTTPPTLTGLLGKSYSGGSGRIMLDYVRPTALAPANTPPLFQINELTTPLPSPQSPGDISISINLALSRLVSGKLITVPNPGPGAQPADTVTSAMVAPRNLGHTAP